MLILCLPSLLLVISSFKNITATAQIPAIIDTVSSGVGDSALAIKGELIDTTNFSLRTGSGTAEGA